MTAQANPKPKTAQCGELALRFGGLTLPLRVLQSAAGYYLGTLDEDGMPYSRESVAYWRKPEEAEATLKDTSSKSWTQKPNP